MIDDDAQLERDLLLARRLKLAVRLVFYPLLLGALLLALHIRHAQAQPQSSGAHLPGPRTVWTGEIAGAPVSVSTRDGIAVHFSGTLRLTCDDGSAFLFKDDLGADSLVRTGEAASYRPRQEHTTSGRGDPVTYNEDLTVQEGNGAVFVSWDLALAMTRAGRVVRCATAQVHATLQEAGTKPGAAKAAAAPSRPATRYWRSLGQPQVVLTRNGRVMKFDGLIDTRCDDGQTFRLTWWQVPSADIVQHGREAVVVKAVDTPQATDSGGGTFTYRARARIRIGARAVTATTGATVVWQRWGGVTTVCRRAPVRQTLHETIN